MFLIDPDGGANVQNKLQGAHMDKKSEGAILLQAIPDVKDTLWTKEIYKVPAVTFSSNFQYLADCKILRPYLRGETRFIYVLIN